VASAIESKIGGVFIPVSNIEKARDWYCRLLARPVTEEVLFGHLYVLAMQGSTGLVLDSKDFAGPHASKPVFHFNSKDLAQAREHALANGAGEVSPIQDAAFFTFKDPDGNLLMVADVPPVTPLRDEEPGEA